MEPNSSMLDSECSLLIFKKNYVCYSWINKTYLYYTLYSLLVEYVFQGDCSNSSIPAYIVQIR